MSEGRGQGRFILGFFMGGLIGALVIFFLGTKEGQKTGKMLKRKGEDMLDDVQDKIEELEERGKDLAKQGEEIKEQVLENLEEKKDTVTHATAEKLDTALAHIEELQEHGRQTTASLRKRLFKNLPKKA